MSQTKQITEWALHKFLEKVEEAVIAGYRTHKTPTSFAKSIGGRYVVTMVKVEEAISETGVVAKAATPARKTPAKKTGDSDE